MKHTRILRLLLAGALLLSLTAVQAQHRRFYFKETRPLTLEPGRVAVQLKPTVTAQRFTQALATRGVISARLKSHAVQGWSEIELPAGNTRPTPQNALTAALNTQQAEYVSPVFKDETGRALIINRDILVRFEPKVTPEQAEALLAGTGELLERNFGGMAGAYRVRHRGKNGFETLEAANRLAQRPEVRWSEPNMILTGSFNLDPNDPLFPFCWGLYNNGINVIGVPGMDMDARAGWDFTIGNSSIIVVVMDSGVEQNHPDIHQRVGRDFTNNTDGGGPVNQYDNHGTQVAGCVSATINNSLGVVGIAPGCRVASARVAVTVNSSGNFNSDITWIINALNWAQTIGARVTNFSASISSVSSITDKYSATRNAGIIHFSATGNSGAGTIGYPGNLATVNAVGAIDSYGDRASFSQYGTGIDFVAPGKTIWTTDRTGSAGGSTIDYDVVDGTSFASPFAAGVAALILSLRPSLTPAQVEAIMQAGCHDRGAVGYDTEYGWGLVSAYRSLRQLELYVDATNTTAPWNGTPADPYRRVDEALNTANPSVMVDIRVRPNAYPENILTNRIFRILNWNNSSVVRIGQP